MLDLKNNYKDRRIFLIVIVLVIVIGGVGVFAYNKNNNYKLVMENQYNMAFYELVSYVKNVQNYLAKSLISSSPEHGAETLTHVWREANLASAYLSQLPISTQELSNTEKFLNQVSDYSYALSRKNIYKESLSSDDFKNLKELHTYSVDLENTLNQLVADFQSGNIKWSELNHNGAIAFAQEVSNMSTESFSNMEGNFEKYEGLIYDGAFSEHMTNPKRLGLIGEEIEEETAKNKVYEFFDSDKIEEVKSNGIIENGNIQSYDFYVKMKNQDEQANISISKKGGHLVLINYNRNVNVEELSHEEAVKKGKEYLLNHGFDKMEETYYLKQDGILTINYAYKQEDVIIYSDLIKVKVALDNGEILGVESTGYLNSHHERILKKPIISISEAKETLNKDLEILSEGKAIIPTEWLTEIDCYEFKGKVDDTNFLVYINIENGREENILVIIDTPNGTLTV